MKTSEKRRGTLFNIGILAAIGILILSGCATKKYVGEQITPVRDNVSEIDTRVAELGGRVTANEDKISKLDTDLRRVDEKAEEALAGFGKLKLERRLLVDMREGAHFALNSAELTDDGKQLIDGFISTLDRKQNVVFLIAGHTDSAGPRDFNYELGKWRADAVSRYLMLQKKIDPFRVVTVSYGENSPIAGNDTREGRAKNRRAEILVYREILAK